MTNDHKRRRPPQDHFSIGEVLAHTGWSRATLYRRIAAGQFPKACRLVERTAYWRIDDINQVIRAPSRYEMLLRIAMGLV